MSCFLTVLLSFHPYLPAQQLGESQARRYISILEQAGRGDYDGALAELYSFTADAPWFTQAYNRIAAFALYSRRTDEADSFFVRQSATHPGNALYGRGLIAKYLKNYPGAVDFLTQSVRVSPRCIEPFIALGECSRRDKSISPDRIIRTLEELSLQDSLNPAPLIGLCEVYKTDIQKQFGLSYAARALRIDSSALVVFYYCYAKIYNEAYNVYPRDYREVTTILERFAREVEETDDQLFASAHYLLGLAYHIRTSESPDVFYLWCGREYSRAYEIAKRFGNKEQIAGFLISMGQFDQMIGNYQQALEREKTASALSRDLGRQDLEARGYLESAFIEYLLGNYREAVVQYKKAGDIQLQFRNGYAFRAFQKVADIYREVHDQAHALDYIDRALAALDSGTYTHGFPEIMQTKGDILLEENLPLPAIQSFNDGLRVARLNPQKYHIAGMLTLGLANAYSALGNEPEAVKHYADASNLLERFTDTKAQLYLGLARFHRRYRRFRESISFYHKLLSSLGKEDWNADYDLLVTAHEELGAVFTTTGKTDSAFVNYAEGIATIERIRTTVQNEFQAAQILSKHMNLYTNSAHLLVRAGKIDQAFEMTEQARARTLQDRQFEATMKFSRDIPDTLRTLQHVLDEQYLALNSRLSTMPSEGSTDATVRRVQDSLDIVETGRRRVSDLISQIVGTHESLLSSLLRAPQVRQRLGKDEAVISYIWSDDGCGAFVITHDNISYTRLPVARDSLIGLIASVSPRFSPKAAAASSLFRSSYDTRKAMQLATAIFLPLLPSLAGRRSLTIIPDDVLHYVPFEALPLAFTAGSDPYAYDAIEFLIHRYTIRYLPSVNAIGWEVRHRENAEQPLLAIGNPSFGSTSGVPKKNSTAGLISRLRQEVNDSMIVSLPFTGIEIADLASLIQGTQQVVGSEATVDRFRSEASKYQILHIATHFFVDDRQPMYSRLLFTPTEPSQRASYMHTYELYQMRLNADLTVLSACNTGIGILQRGEGLNGIAQAFIAAGSPSLVVSLWSVDDRSTSILMKFFYTGLLAGKTKSEALREAKLRLIREGYSDPVYWASFVLMGDDKPVKLMPRAYPAWLSPAFILTAFLLLVAISYRRKLNYQRKGHV